jgi:hypothetical protein
VAQAPKIASETVRPVHAGRHYFGTALCRARANVRSVQKLLGHSNLITTMRYVHAVDRDLETAFGDLEALTLNASATPRRPLPPSSAADTERSAESERRPSVASRGEPARNARQPTLEAGAA